jgi:hypothetical protein
MVVLGVGLESKTGPLFEKSKTEELKVVGRLGSGKDSGEDKGDTGWVMKESETDGRATVRQEGSRNDRNRRKNRRNVVLC